MLAIRVPSESVSGGGFGPVLIDGSSDTGGGIFDTDRTYFTCRFSARFSTLVSAIFSFCNWRKAENVE